MRRFHLTCVSAVLLSLLAASAQAAVSTQSFSHLLKRGDNLPEGLEVVNLSVDRFDAALGSLTGVAFTLASDFSGGAVFYHPTLSLSFGYTPRHTLAVEVGGIADPPDLTLDHTLPAQSYTDTTPWGGSYWVPTAQEHYEQVIAALAGTLDQYVGDSPYDLTITLEDRSVYTASNPLAYINDKYVISDLTLTVSYTYTPAVPEPQTWAILVAGLGLVGLAARRRGRQQKADASGIPLRDDATDAMAGLIAVVVLQ